MINLEPFDLIAPESTPAMLKQAREQALRRINRLLEAQGLQADRYQIIVGEGAVSEVLLDILQRHHIDLAVLGTHGRRAFKKLRLGSIAQEVSRTAPCPVLTIGQRTRSAPTNKTLRHILYPLEFAPDSSDAAKCAVSLAQQYTASLTVMNVTEDMPSATNKKEQFTEPVEAWIEDHVPVGSDVRNRVRFERGFGPATDASRNFASQAAVDVIGMSVRRLDSAISAHLPKLDTAYEVVSRAPCPVLTIR